MSIQHDIIQNYVLVEESIVSQLALNNSLHNPSTGVSREEIWLQLFEMIIPKKFMIEHSIFIIDSGCNVSREVDLAIIDNMYTPYIFQHGKMKYVPIEAVAAVIECKSETSGMNSDEEKSTLKKWSKTIEKLKTSNQSITRMAAGMMVDGIPRNLKAPFYLTQTSTRPIRIFCGYETKGKQENILELFDFVLRASVSKNQKKIDVLCNETTDLAKWYEELNHHKFEENENVKKANGDILKDKNLNDFKVINNGKEISLLSFNFQLNQLLMLLNNPMLFPHLAYVNMFNMNDMKE